MANKLSLILEAVDRITKPLSGIVARVKRLNAQLKLDGLVDSGRQVGKAFGNVARDAAKMARIAAVAAGVVGAGLFAMVKRAADASDAVTDMAGRIGNIGAGALQKLGWAAQLGGSNLDDMGQGLAALNKRVVASVTGNKTMAENFRRIGISVKDANGKLKPTELILAEIADKFQAMPDGAKKSALAMALFGNQVGLRLVPVLNAGSAGLKEAGDEFERLHGTLSEDASAAAGRFNDALDRMFMAIEGVQQAIAQKLFPVLTPLIQQFTEWVAANREWIATKIGDFIAALPGYISGARSALTALLSALAPVVSAFRLLVEWIGPTNAALIGFGLVLGGKLLFSVIQLAVALASFGKALAFTSAGLVRIAASLAAGLISPIGLAVAAVALIAGAVYLIYRNWDAVGPWFKRLWDNVIGIFRGFYDFVAGVFTGDIGRAIEGLTAIFEGYVKIYATLWDGVKGVFNAFSTWVRGTFGVDLSAAFKAVWNLVAPIVEAIENGIGKIMEGYDKVKAKFGGAVETAGSFFNSVGDAIAGAVSGAGADSVPLAGPSKVDAGGTVRFVIDDKRARVEAARPNDPRVEWSFDTGPAMAMP